MKRNSLLIAAALIFCSSAAVVAIAQKPRTAMYLYQSTAGDQAFAAGERRKAFVNKPNWKQIRLVGYAYAQSVAGTTPLLEIARPVKGGNRYYYSIDYQEANAVMKADNMYKISDYNNGQSAYVSATKKPGTIPVYLYSQPTEALNYLYIFGDKENNAFKSVAQKSGIKFEKIAFYIWEKQTDSSVGGNTDSEDATSDGQSPIIITGPIGKETSIPIGKIAPVDFSMRDALYLNGAKTNAVDTTAGYVSANQRMTVKKSDAVNCEGELCTFNLGFIVYRSNAEGESVTDAAVEAKGLLKTRVKIGFKAGEKSRQIVHPYKLKIGENLIYVTLDPMKTTAETDENNNNFRATIVVQP